MEDVKSPIGNVMSDGASCRSKVWFELIVLHSSSFLFQSIDMFSSWNLFCGQSCLSDSNVECQGYDGSFSGCVQDSDCKKPSQVRIAHSGSTTDEYRNSQVENTGFSFSNVALAGLKIKEQDT